jgi:hypothetical protein
MLHRRHRVGVDGVVATAMAVQEGGSTDGRSGRRVDRFRLKAKTQ